MTENQQYWTALLVSLVAAFLGWQAPTRRMPIDYEATIWWSVPIAIGWAMILAFCLWRHKKRGLWLIVGAPMALYWPVWLLFALQSFPAVLLLAQLRIVELKHRRKSEGFGLVRTSAVLPFPRRLRLTVQTLTGLRRGTA